MSRLLAAPAAPTALAAPAAPAPPTAEQLHKAAPNRGCSVCSTSADLLRSRQKRCTPRSSRSSVPCRRRSSSHGPTQAAPAALNQQCNLAVGSSQHARHLESTRAATTVPVSDATLRMACGVKKLRICCGDRSYERYAVVRLARCACAAAPKSAVVWASIPPPSGPQSLQWLGARISGHSHRQLTRCSLTMHAVTAVDSCEGGRACSSLFASSGKL